MAAPKYVDVTLEDDAVVRYFPAEQPGPLPSPLANQSLVRVGLTTQNSSTTWHLFADAMRTARPIGGDGSCVVFVEQVAADGSYLLMLENAACVVTLMNSGSSSINPLPVPGEYQVVVPHGQKDLWLKFAGDPGRVRLIRPGHAEWDLFHKNALAQLAPWGGIRAMDLMQTNYSTVTEWNTRSLPSDQVWSLRDNGGVPVEILIELANVTGKDLWLNIPHKATDGYVSQLATLVKATLRKDVFCYIEYGNENWNSHGDFKTAFDWTLNRSRVDVAAGDIQLTKADEHLPGFPNGLKPDGTARNETNAHHRWLAKRTVQCRALWGHDERVRFVYCDQNGYSPPGHWFKHALEYIASYHGSPASHLYAVGSAPYGGIGNLDPSPEMRAGIKLQADRFDLKYVAYECLYHNTTGGQAMADLHAHESAAGKTETILNNYFNSGLSEVFVFVVGSRWLVAGNAVELFGMTNGTHVLRSPKYDGAAKVASERKRT